MELTSAWQDTRTFFPLVQAEVQQRGIQTACVVGASDGKFVLPLAAAGVKVYAVERNPVALNGGPVVYPGPREGHMPGLRARLKAAGLTDQVTVVEDDFLAVAGDIPKCDLVWTSCSWHYSVNHRVPLAEFIGAMLSVIHPGGLFGAEYMMPVEYKHLQVEHYLQPGHILRYLPPELKSLWEVYTEPFVEEPHVEQLTAHVHRMGFMLAAR